MLTLINKGGGGTQSAVLPNNPTITLQASDKKLTVTWTKPSSEINIQQYNIYYSTTSPTSLKQMTRAGTTTSLTYEITNLTNDTLYYVVVTSVSVEGYENASVSRKSSATPFGRLFVAIGGPYTNQNSFISEDGETWQPAYLTAATDNYKHIKHGFDRTIVAPSQGAYGGGITPSYLLDGLTNWVRSESFGSATGAYQLISDAVGYDPGSSEWSILYLTQDSANLRCAYADYTALSWNTTSVTTTVYSSMQYVDMQYFQPTSNYILISSGYYTYIGKKSSWSFKSLSMPYPGSTSLRAIACSEQRAIVICAVGTDNDAGAYYLDRDNLSQWLPSSGLPRNGQYQTGLAYGNNIFTMFAVNGGKWYCYYSIDGSTWTNTGFSISAMGSLGESTFSVDRFVTVTTNDNGIASYYSLDGKYWTAMSFSSGQPAKLMHVCGK